METTSVDLAPIVIYDADEAHAMTQLPNRVIEAAAPCFFNHIGYPTRINSMTALWRYADVMHENRFENDFKTLLGGGLTSEEWHLAQKIGTTVREITKHRCQHEVFPSNALVRGLFNLRYMDAAAEVVLGPVLEIGPGSGYLTALMASTGREVITVENSQAFYIWQMTMLSKLQLKINQQTWWQFYANVRDTVNEFRPTLIWMNHCVCELHANALAFIGTCARHWGATIIVEGPGDQGLMSHNDAFDILGWRGVTPWMSATHHNIGGPNARKIADQFNLLEATPRPAIVGIEDFKILRGSPPPDDLWLTSIERTHT